MQPLSTFDLYLNIFNAIVLPLLILANLSGWVARSPANAFLWREHANLMRLSMAILGLLSLWSIAQIAGHFGFISGPAVEVVVMVIGVPFLFAAVAEIWLGAKLVRQWVRWRLGRA